MFSSRTVDWTLLRPRGPLVRRVGLGIAEGGVAVASDGRPVLFAAVPVRISGPRSGVIVVGEPIKAVDLEEVARPLDLTLALAYGGYRISGGRLAFDRRIEAR